MMRLVVPRRILGGYVALGGYVGMASCDLVKAVMPDEIWRCGSSPNDAVGISRLMATSRSGAMNGTHLSLNGVDLLYYSEDVAL